MMKKKSKRARAARCSECAQLMQVIENLRESIDRQRQDLNQAYAERDGMAKLLDRAAAHDTARGNAAREMRDRFDAIIKLGLALPGLYVTAADGRPSFTSQAAADFVNAIQEYDAIRFGQEFRANRAPPRTDGERVTVSRASNANKHRQ
jgi:hypothetical protein